MSGAQRDRSCVMGGEPHPVMPMGYLGGGFHERGCHSEQCGDNGCDCSLRRKRDESAPVSARQHRDDAVAFTRSAASKHADARSFLKLLEILEADPATYCRSADYLDGVRARLLLVVSWMRADAERDSEYADAARHELGVAG